MPGSDTLARNARGTEPRSCTCTLPLPRLLDTQKNGTGRSSISPGRCASISCSMRRPRRNEMIGTVTSPNGLPSTKALRARCDRCRPDRARRPAGGHHRADAGAAEPVDRRCPASCNARYTPRCAKPRAAPPPSTRPTALPGERPARRARRSPGTSVAHVQVEIESCAASSHGAVPWMRLAAPAVTQHQRPARHGGIGGFECASFPFGPARRFVATGRPAGSGPRGAAPCR